MPPHVPRKRLRETPPTDESKPKTLNKGKAPALAVNRRKATLYDDLDAAQPSQTAGPGLLGSDEDDSDSSLTSLSDAEFEDVPLAKRHKRSHDGSDDDDDDDIEFEDVEAPTVPSADAPVTSGDLELTLNRDTRISLTNPFGEKKGPSKWERKVRNATHCMHVLCLLWHNAVRNSWCCDPEVQAIMLSHIPPRLWEGVERWRRNSGLVKTPPPLKSKAKAKSKGKQSTEKRIRDWGLDAKKLEEGEVDMSHGDPLFRLMQPLVSWWKQRFSVSAPGVRKWGYMSLERLDRVTKAYEGSESDQEQFGERIEGLEDFRECAQKCQGSRDVGAQLFTALLRGLGLEARMIANLQSLGFGWNKLEDAEVEPEESNSPAKTAHSNHKTPEKKTNKARSQNSPAANSESKKMASVAGGNTPKPSRSTRKGTGNAKPIMIEDSDDLKPDFMDTDDESVVELLVTPKKGKPIAKTFDKDLEYPHYWTEVLSPVTNKYLPVDAIVKGISATNRDMIESLEPRGSKADKARQTMAYIVGYSPDGTAKDVTVRYLKRQTLPGRTKGARMPPMKNPVYNRHGKVKGYDHFDWFKSAMCGYRRGGKDHPVTEADEEEDSTELKPNKPEKKEVKEGEETLQYYKQSKEYVLERHLKREEALRSDALPVKVFRNKGKGSKGDAEDVYLRADVLPLKSAETWHKQGRAPIEGEEPLKRVPYRAATINRRREIAEAEASTGGKVLQGLFSFQQTDWIIPPPIKDGIIPKNGYGNMDLFMEHMCPEGAVHVPFRGAMRVCKRLEVDYAEAVVDFEFGNRMAVPVIQGVVIAEEYHDTVMEALREDEIERARKEDEKRRKGALGRWRKFLMGMRIVERIRQDYGEIGDDVSVFGHGSAAARLNASPKAADEDTAGGFLPEGYEEEEDGDEQALQTSSFFPVVDEDGEVGDDNLIMEDSRREKAQQVIGAASAKTAESGKTAVAGSSRKTPAKRRETPRRSTRGRGRRTVASDDDEDEKEEDGDDDWVNPDGGG